jgi:cytochrome c oxidase assembly protein subunit 15
MIHRYFAGTLGLLILFIFVVSAIAKRPLLLPFVLLATVTFQAFLGMLTVTMSLMPLVVLGHLMGGFTTFCLLLLYVKQQHKAEQQPLMPEQGKLFRAMPNLLKVGALVVILQIALGGWTATNYSAVACTSLPICEPGWQEKFSIGKAFTVAKGHANYEFGVLPHDVRVSIHITHRLGAVIVALVIILLSWSLIRMTEARKKQQGYTLLGILVVQFILGVSNVVFKLPLLVAVAHNFVALCLLAYLIHLIWEWHHIQRDSTIPITE